ncbi:hypothetical protein Vretimale_18578, partial [Volvox reticuliferus]
IGCMYLGWYIVEENTAVALTLALAVAIAARVKADLYFPNIPPATSEAEKHSVLSVHHAIVGRGVALRPNAAARANKMVGGFQLLTRSGTPDGPGKLVDIGGEPVMAYGPGYIKGATQETSVYPDATTLLPRAGDPTKADL